MSDQEYNKAEFPCCTCDTGWCAFHRTLNVHVPIKDPINPAHYKAGSPIEIIRIIEGYDLNYLEGNAIKYILRARRKGKHLEDLHKAHWYLDRLIRRVANGTDEEGITLLFPTQDR